MIKQKRLNMAALLLIAFICLSVVMPVKVSAEGKKKILIDAGHGGIDGGAVGADGTIEKDLNLAISKKLKEVLKNKGYEIIMVREEDLGLYTDNGTIRKKKLEDLNNRSNLIKDSGCDMFISIHLNIFQQSKYHGAQVWYADNNLSSKFGRILQDNLREDLDKDNDRKIKCAKQDYIILRNCPEIPAAIVECGFMSNPDELIKLKDNDYQQKIANSITKSVDGYYSVE